MSARPLYSELTEGDATGVFGERDRLGCLNLLTPERTVMAARGIATGEVFSLNAPLLEYNEPSFFSCYREDETGWPEGWVRAAPAHTVVAFEGGMGHDDKLDGFYMQSSTQWDHFWHCGDSRAGRFYNGHSDMSQGIERWAERGIVGRGVLLDVARWAEESRAAFDWRSRYAVTVQDLERCASWEAVEVTVGTILLVRVGWQSGYATLDPSERSAYARDRPLSPGLEPSQEMAARLWDWGVAAVASDNPALEPWPLGEYVLHEDLLGRLGIPIGELWLLDELAAACKRTSKYEFLLTSAPLNVRGGTGSPANALAIL